MKTEKELAMEILEKMDGKEIKLSVSKLKWTTQPSGGDLEHVLTVTINMSSDARAQVEDLAIHYWQQYCILGGSKKAEQGQLGFEEGAGYEGGLGAEAE